MPGIRLEITVDDKGTPVVRQFNQEVGKTGETATQAFDRPRDAQGRFIAGLQQTTREASSTGREVDRLGNSLANSIRAGAGIAAGALGFTGVAGLVTQTVTAMTGLQSALANVNTLGIQSGETQARLREQILAIPPALGTTTELARGLYDVLSSGVPTENAVSFLETSARLANAGLAPLSVTTTALTKIIQGYGLATTDATRVSDILFQTVNVGQGTLEQFAGAFPRIIPLSKALGISLEEAAATLGTLSLTFPSAAEAATGYIGTLQGLSQSASKLAAVGINVRQVIAEEGLTGVLTRLREVTGGNTTALQEYIGQQEGQISVLALTNALLEKQRQNIDTVRNSTGSTSNALREQAKTVETAWREFTNTLERLTQQAAPPFLAFLTNIANKATEAANEARKIPEAFRINPEAKKALDDLPATLDQIAKERGLDGVFKGVKDFFANGGLDIVRTVDSLSSSSQALDNLRKVLETTTPGVGAWRDETARATQAQYSLGVSAEELAAKTYALQEAQGDGAKAVKALSDATNEQLVGALKQLGIESQKAEEDGIRSLVRALMLAATSGEVAFTTIQAEAAKLQERLRAIFGAVPPEYRDFFARILGYADTSARGIETAFREAGLRTRQDLQETALAALKNFTMILESGESTPEKLLEVWQRILKQITDAGFKTLPPGFQEIARRMEEIARRLGIELPKPFLDAFGKIDAAGKRVADEFEKKFDDTFKALATAGATNTRQLATSLTEAQIKAAFELGLISRHAYETALALKQAGAEGGQGFAEGVTAGTEEARGRLRQVADDARAVSIVFRQAFGDTPRQLFEQLRDQRTRLANANQIAAAAGLTEPGNFEAYRKQIIDSANDAIYLITERLRDLGYNADGTRIMLDTLAESTTQLEQATSMLATTTTEAGTALQQQATGPVQSLGAGYIMAAMGAQALIDRQRELLALAGGSQITDAPGRNRPVAAGSGTGGGSSLLGGPPLLVPTGGSLPGGLSPADLGLSLTRPTQPGSLSLPVRIPVAPTAERSPLLTGFPGGVTTTAPTVVAATGGGPILTGNEQTFQGGQGGPGRGGNIVDRVPTIGGGSTRSINVTVNTMALTRGAAQDLAQNLAPALRELQRRGEI